MTRGWHACSAVAHGVCRWPGVTSGSLVGLPQSDRSFCTHLHSWQATVMDQRKDTGRWRQKKRMNGMLS